MAFGSRYIQFCAAVLAASAFLIGACSGDDGEDSPGLSPIATSASAASTSPATAEASAAATGTKADPGTTPAPATAPLLKIGQSNKGNVLTDANGLTLYTFKNDAGSPGKSTCNASCAASWPPLTTSETIPAALPAGASGTVSAITRDDGSRQITFNGSPLYRYEGDREPGSVAGDRIGEVWFAVMIGATTTPAAAPGQAGESPTPSYNY
ncbi:MAG: hypothetical protein ACKVT1_15260 [Dehalococcoidia bacterium]